MFATAVCAYTPMKRDYTYTLIVLYFIIIYCRLLIVMMTYHAGDKVG